MNLRRDDLIGSLREEVKRTRALYETAKAEESRALERVRELGADHPDGNVRHATQVCTFTLQNHRKALIRFNRLILDGKLPDD